MKAELIEKIKEDILGREYELSFAFINKSKIHKLNKFYRKKDKPTDILAFPLSDHSGEMVICKEIAKLKSEDFNIKFQNYLIFLVIHGMLHLKGMDHGSKMEQAERLYLSKSFPKLNFEDVFSYYSRNRRGHLRSTRGRSRAQQHKSAV